MSYLHHSYAFGGHAGIPMEQPVACGPPMAHPAMAGSMDGYLLARAPYDLPEYYSHLPIMEDYEEYAENLSRPRLTKEQVETLEAQFQAHPKPNSNVKRQLAAQTNLSLPRVANWFQNRRAKAKQQKRQEEFERMQREAKEKDDQTRSKAEELQEESDSTSHTTRTPGQQRDRAATPTQASTATDRLQTSASSASRPKHQKTRSEVTREKTFASLQRALNAAVAARDHYGESPDAGILAAASDMSMDIPASNLPVAESAPQSSLNSAFSEWGSSRDSSIAWTPSQSPEEGFEFGSLNAVPFASPEDRLPMPHLESPPNPDMAGVHGLGSVPLSHQQQTWTSQIQGNSENLAEDAHGSQSMYGALQFSSLQLPGDPTSRRGSSSEELTESMGNIGIKAAQAVPQLPNRMEGPVWRRPEKELDLAARRKRPRPAAIGTSLAAQTLVSPSSMSPTTRITSFGGPHALRHAKSSHALGSRYAGVRKISAAQRSPLGFSNFADAASASINPHRRLQTSASAGNLAPPSPLTPEDLQHLLPTTPRKSQYTLSGQQSADRQLFPTTQPMQINVASPPATPLHLDLLSQLQYQNLAPPISAPAQYASFPEYSPLSSGPLTGVSWAVSTPDTASFQSNLQIPSVPAYVYEADDDDSQGASWPLTNATPLYGSVKVSDTPPATMMLTEDDKVTQFHIHEFPKQQEAHRSVAQQLPPQQPKHYTFTNQTPNDFNFNPNTL